VLPVYFVFRNCGRLRIVGVGREDTRSGEQSGAEREPIAGV